jgi:hypothetical protein
MAAGQLGFTKAFSPSKRFRPDKRYLPFEPENPSGNGLATSGCEQEFKIAAQYASIGLDERRPTAFLPPTRGRNVILSHKRRISSS